MIHKSDYYTNLWLALNWQLLVPNLGEGDPTVATPGQDTQPVEGLDTSESGQKGFDEVVPIDGIIPTTVVSQTYEITFWWKASKFSVGVIPGSVWAGLINAPGGATLWLAGAQGGAGTNPAGPNTFTGIVDMQATDPVTLAWEGQFGPPDNWKPWPYMAGNGITIPGASGMGGIQQSHSRVFEGIRSSIWYYNSLYYQPESYPLYGLSPSTITVDIGNTQYWRDQGEGPFKYHENEWRLTLIIGGLSQAPKGTLLDIMQGRVELIKEETVQL